jgi:hypothetical protein
MRRFPVGAVLPLVLFFSLPPVFASSGYLSSARQRYPQITGTRLDSCSLCHTNVPSLNSYGSAYRSAGRSFASIESLDTDADGYPNVAELGAITFPSDKSDYPKTNLYFPTTVATTSSSTGFAVTNTGSSAATVVLNLYQDSGQGAGGVTPYRVMTMPAHSQIANVAQELFGSSLQLASGWVRLASGQSGITGFFLNYDNALSGADGTEAWSVASNTLVFPVASQAELSLVNPSQTATVNADVTLFDDNGRPAGTATAQIPVNGRFAAKTETLFPGVSSGYVTVKTSAGIAGTEFFGAAGSDPSALNGLDGSAGGKTIYTPQFAAGGGVWRSSLTLINMEANPTSAILSFMSDSGEQLGKDASLTIPAGGRAVVSDLSVFGLPAVPDSLTEGYVRIASTNTRIAGFVGFGDVANNRFQTALPCVVEGSMDLVFSQVAQDQTWFTGLAVLNPNAAAADLTVSVYRTDGTIAGTGTLRLEPNRRFSNLLSEIVPGMPSMSKGYFTVSSTLPVFGFAVFGTNSVLSAIPPQ